MQALRRFHPHVRLILAALGLLSACAADDDAATTADPASTCTAATCATASGGASGQATGGSHATAGGSGSGGHSAGMNSSGAGGVLGASSGSGGAKAGSGGASAGSGGVAASGSGGSMPATGSGGTSAVDAGAPLPDYTLVVDAPTNGATVSGKVMVTGRAPGFVNIEVWDAMHQMPPLVQGAPDADGKFELTIDAGALTAGATTWTVYAWDSAPGQSFSHTQNVAIALTITAATSTGDCNGQTCSGHGTCAATGGAASCSCESGFHAVGMECDADSVSNDGTADPGTAYVPSGYSLVFNDEFSAAALDTKKWNTLGPWGVQFFSDSKQKQAFVPEAVSLHDGILTFTADHASGSDANGQPYSSGSITTNGTFTHGYFEARVKVPAGKGFWPAYWVTSSTRWPPEWDIFEIIDGVIYGYPHPITSGKCQFVEGASGSDSTYTISNLYGVYHVYGFKWTATDIDWYVDGVLTEHYAIDDAAGANDPYWLNISFQLGGDWPGDPDSSTPLPAHMDVDYMRVYQQQ